MYIENEEILSQDEKLFARSVNFLVFVRSTMGYGDILPVTHEERIFAIIVAIIGAVVFSYCMGTISTLITQAPWPAPVQSSFDLPDAPRPASDFCSALMLLQVAGVDVRFDEKMRGVVEYMQYREFSDDLKRKVCRGFTSCYAP
jgi:hypothetical protein